MRFKHGIKILNNQNLNLVQKQGKKKKKKYP
jgi:hypothetical protein